MKRISLQGIRYSPDEGRSAPDESRCPQLLVLGYHGTLKPDSDSSPMASKRGDEDRSIPGFAVQRWLERASRELQLRVGSKRSEDRGERIDHGALIDALRDRIRGMLIQVMILCPATDEERIALEFPVLSRLLQNAIVEWADAVAVFHQRFHRDGARLAAWLGYAKLPDLESLTPAGSDQHAGAHTAMRILFRDGCCIYYKPRPVTGEWLWDRLVHTVNSHSSLELASTRALEGANGRYGWVTSLQPHGLLHDWDKLSVNSSKYWQAAGATLCLAEHVRMTDLHMANVKATCQGPALFDTECLGTPRAISGTLTRYKVERTFATTVDDLLDTGLLPQENSAALRGTSGLFGKASSVPQVLIPRWSSGGGGGQCPEVVPAALVEQGNAPPFASLLDVLPLLVSGYREAASALMRCRDSLVSPNSAWRWTLEHLHAPRIILCDTVTYGFLLSQLLQPKQLQTEQRRQAALRGALRGLPRDQTFAKAILRTEARSLLDLHIPRFIGLPGSRTLASNGGRVLVPRYLSCTPAEGVLRKIGELTLNRLSEIQIPGLLQAVIGQLRRG